MRCFEDKSRTTGPLEVFGNNVIMFSIFLNMDQVRLKFRLSVKSAVGQDIIWSTGESTSQPHEECSMLK